ncbi:MAG: DUF4142 domain-containing protein [Phycisphaerae bacterium]|nr:DUF4142 domain-containing protein [Phycisphaerae bacterium]
MKLRHFTRFFTNGISIARIRDNPQIGKDPIMTTRSCSRKFCIAIAALGLGLSTSVPLFAADDAKDAGKDMADMKAKVEEQDNAVKSLQASFSDSTFVTVASMANNDEIKAAEAANSMSANEEVKKFAQHMIDDHTQAGTDLKALAEKKGWHVSDACDAKHMIALDEMKKMTGTAFDKSYVVAQVKDHEDAVALFKLAADKASDNDLKDFAKSKLPTFEDHLKMARKLESKLMANP